MIMAVYVDDMRASYRRMVMCHMIATTDDELHLMASRLGMSRLWFQKGNHYDVSANKRALAVKYGAIEITWKQAGMMTALVRWGYVMPKPEIAKVAYLAALELRKYG